MNLKRPFLFFATLTILLIENFAFAALPPQEETPPPKTVQMTFHNIFVPEKLVATDETYAVISGDFSSGCYAWSKAEVTPPSQAAIVEVRAYALVAQGQCLEVFVPYSKRVSLGKLAPGEYQIRFKSGDGTYFDRPLTIE
jgi:hypothetical protein